MHLLALTVWLAATSFWLVFTLNTATEGRTPVHTRPQASAGADHLACCHLLLVEHYLAHCHRRE